MAYSIEEDIKSLEKMIGKPISDIIYYRHLTLKEKIDYIDKLYQKAKEDMKDTTLPDNPNQYLIVSNWLKSNNIDHARSEQKNACLCCGIGIVEKYKHFCYLLKPHRIVYGYMKGDYIPSNIVMLCYKCHSKEYDYFTKNRHRLYQDFGKKRPLSWNELKDVSFDIFKEFITENHECTDTEIENNIVQDIEQEIVQGIGQEIVIEQENKQDIS